MSVTATSTVTKTRTIMLAEKCRDAEKNLSEEYGGFTLFCLVQRESTAGKWDIVVSAPWLTTRMADTQRIVDGMLPFLTQEDWLRTAGVVPVEPNSDFVQTLTSLFHAEHEIQQTGPIYTDDVLVDRAVIITANQAAGAR